MKQKYIDTYMRVADVFAELSYAERRKVGCVVVKDDTIIALGYNGTPTGWDNDCEDEWNKTKPEVIHAEQNALDKIVRSTTSSVGADMFVTTAPCIECAKRILGAKINKVYYRDIYRNDDGIQFLNKGGIVCERIAND
jgi:dCMP deaminase